MRLIAVLFACLGFMSTALAESVGVFTVTRGPVQVLRAENYLAAAPGVEVQSDDILETGKAASAQVDMEDGSVLKLGPETRVSLSDYKLDSSKSVVSATLDVLSGWLRFAVAKLKPQGRYSFNTPVLTIGVRGTEGTIEAQNEQGGLHLEEGAVDVAPLGPDIAGLQPIRVTSGEFIQRLRGQQLAKLPQPPAAFQKRLPPIVQEKLTRRAQDLKERGVPPRVIRAITREDAKRIMERHPHMQDKLRQRFNKSIGNPNDKSIGNPNEGAKGKAPADGEKEVAPTGFGGRVLRERQMKTGSTGDPKDVSEGLRRRFQQQQLDKAGAASTDKTAEPALTDTLQRPGVVAPGATTPLGDKSTVPFSDKSTLQPTVQPTLRSTTPISPTLRQLPPSPISPTTPTSPTKLPETAPPTDSKTQYLEPATTLKPTTTIQSR